MSERCICCGEAIPEGRQVCPACEKGTKREEMKMAEKYTMMDFIMGERIAVQTGTGEKLKRFLAFCDQIGLEWWPGWSASKLIPTQYGEGCCISNERCFPIHVAERGKLAYGSRAVYEMNGYEIVQVEDIMPPEAKAPRYEIKIVCDDDLTVTTARMIVNGRVVKTTTSKRNPMDKFDLHTGCILAFSRLFRRKKGRKISDAK